jgi:hypothetical protein
MKGILALVLTLIVAACAGHDNAAPGASAPQSPALPGIPPSSGGTTGGSSGGTTGSTGSTDWPDWSNGGATVDVNIDKAALEGFLGRPANYGSVVPGKINVWMGDRPDSGYDHAFAGSISLAFPELDANNNVIYRSYDFRAATTDTYGYVDGKWRNITVAEKNHYNGWVTVGSQTVFKAYVQETYGTLLLVTDGQDDSGNLSGHLYYYNFHQCNSSALMSVSGVPPIGPEYADASWMIKMGPFDSRDFLDSAGHGNDDQDEWNMNMARSIYPTRVKYDSQGHNCGTQYTKLLDFTTLNKTQALEN